MSLSIGDPAPDAVLLGEGDAAQHLSTLWKRAPTVLVFLRHFG